ncbi:AraC family ligand binding domain-containing protein [Paenibacillus sp. CC-CFT747]|nr:AraC family ligand binding domain-containing protein [Paenibacillus sp. CC-CFT747]
MNWRIKKLSGDRFFETGFDIFINREEESFSLSQHTHDFIEISYVEEGSGYHYIEDQMIPTKRGTCSSFRSGPRMSSGRPRRISSW